MEVFLGLLVIGIPTIIVAAFVIGIMALSRVRRLEKRVDTAESGPSIGIDHPLARRLRELEQKVRGLEGRFSRTGPLQEQPVPAAEEPVPIPAAEPPPTAPEIPIPSSVPSPKEPPTATTPPAEPPFTPPAATIQKPPRPKLDIDWERWIGVRGAAAAGGIVLALAALLFFQYSIEHGLISPTMRVVFGVLVGISCLVGSEWLIKRNQAPAANALAGAGVVILYGATWAAQILYSLIGPVPAFVLMVMITAVCVMLAIARRAQFIAVLGLLGGFATPLLIASEVAGPIALFGYILLLDLGLLWLARARGWPLLAVLSLVGTALHQAFWIFSTMDAERAVLGLAVLAVFGVGFLLMNGGEKKSSALWRATRAGGVAVPFAFALHFAGTAKLIDNPLSLGALLLVLSGGACWLSRREDIRGAATGAAGASLGVMSLWFITHRLKEGDAWLGVLVCVALAALFTAVAEFSRKHPSASRLNTAALVADIGFLGLLVLATASSRVHQPWPWLVGWVFLGAGIFLLSRRPGREWIQLSLALGPALGLLITAVAHGHRNESLSDWSFATLVIAVALAFQVIAMFRRDERGRLWAERTAGSAAIALMPAAAALANWHLTDAVLILMTLLALGFFALLAATRMRSGLWYLAAVLTTCFWQGVIFAFSSPNPASAVGSILAILGASAVLFTIWVGLSPRAFLETRSAWWGAALAGPLWFVALREAFTTYFGDEFIGILPVVMAMVVLATILRVRPQLASSSQTQRSAMVWYLAVALCLVSLAIPLQLDKQWITIGWALNGLAVLALWKKLDHPGLKYFGLALLGAAGVRLIANPEVLHYHLRSATPLFNWVTYTYLVPAAAMVFSMRLLKDREVQRLKVWEEPWYFGGKSVGAGASGLAAVATVFVWINLAIADLFATGPNLQLSFDRLPARDATTSVAWAVYALVLLAIGVRARSRSLRWLSLSLMVATPGKVFLHDLGELEDLYRVASLAGLAISLIVVSLIYQRFVFGEKS
ncbi:MAG: DUF2339 domain-containing protein [Thermoanaerobaculales bacterium]|nr:DUF2339 domain-containing protein [Thermoanaerobaculales bacterium]